MYIHVQRCEYLHIPYANIRTPAYKHIHTYVAMLTPTYICTMPKHTHPCTYTYILMLTNTYIYTTPIYAHIYLHSYEPSLLSL